MGGGVERLEERVVGEAVEVGRRRKSSVDAEAPADPGQEEGRRAADRPVDGAEDEERRRALVVGVAPKNRQAVDAETAQQHPDVADVPVDLGLEEPAGQVGARELGGDGQPHQVDRPAVQGEDVTALPVQRELVDGRLEPEQGHPTVEEQRDPGDATVRLDGVEPDLLDVQRSQLTLHQDEPRTGRRSGAEAYPWAGPVRVPLHGQCWAQHRPVALARCPRVVHQAVGDPVVPAAGRGGEGEPVQLQLHTAPHPAGRVGRGEGVHRDRVQRHTAEVEERPAGRGDAEAHTGDGELRREGEVVPRAGEQVDRQTPRRSAVDPARVRHQVDPGVALDEPVGAVQLEPDAQRLGRVGAGGRDRHGHGATVEGQLRG